MHEANPKLEYYVVCQKAIVCYGSDKVLSRKTFELDRTPILDQVTLPPKQVFIGKRQNGEFFLQKGDASYSVSSKDFYESTGMNVEDLLKLDEIPPMDTEQFSKIEDLIKQIIERQK